MFAATSAASRRGENGWRGEVVRSRNDQPRLVGKTHQKRHWFCQIYLWLEVNATLSAVFMCYRARMLHNRVVVISKDTPTLKRALSLSPIHRLHSHSKLKHTHNCYSDTHTHLGQCPTKRLTPTEESRLSS